MTVDILVDAPLLGILPQRITVDVEQLSSDEAALFSLLEQSLVDAEGRAPSLSKDTCAILIGQAGTFVKLEDTAIGHLSQWSRLRLVPLHMTGLGGGLVPTYSTSAFLSPAPASNVAVGNSTADADALVPSISTVASRCGAVPDLSEVFSLLANESHAFDPNAPVIGYLQITIVGCDNLMNVNQFKRSSPYVTAFGQARKEVFRTPVAEETLSPRFDPSEATFVLPFNEVSGHVRFRVMSRQFMDAFMGEAILELAELMAQSDGSALILELQPRRNEADISIAGATSLGTITLRCVRYSEDMQLRQEDDKNQTEDDAQQVQQDQAAEEAAAPSGVADVTESTADDEAAAPSAAALGINILNNGASSPQDDPPLFTSPSMSYSNHNQVLPPDETTSVMLDVVKLVIADAVASIPYVAGVDGVDTYELGLRKLDVMRAGVLGDRGWSNRIPDALVSDLFFRAMIEGFQIGVGHKRRQSSGQQLLTAVASHHLQQRDEQSHSDAADLRDQVSDLTTELRAVQRRLDSSLDELEHLREALDAEKRKNQERDEAPKQSPASPPPATAVAPVSTQHHVQPSAVVQRHFDATEPISSSANAEQQAVDAPQEQTTAPAITLLGDESDRHTTVDASVDYTMVVCFYNAFDYVTKTTRKKGRAVSLAASPTSTRFETLTRVVKDTFQREGLCISYLDVDGKRHIISSDQELTALLIKLKANGYRPVFQCLDPAEEQDVNERAEVGSSPRRIFVMRHPMVPEPPVAALANLVTSPSRPSSRPSSASTNRSNIPSAMSVRSSASSMPFDYIAGSALDDDAIAREFDIVACGGETASKEDVLRYLEARYDSIGDYGRFKRLLDSLFWRKGKDGRIDANEFAIVLLRLSQS